MIFLAEQTSYYIDYYMLKRVFPERVYEKVWDDNHKFMFERHLYSEDFFRFIKEVCNCIELPDLSQKNLLNFIYKNHKAIPEETQAIYKNLIQIISILNFHLLAKAHDNSVT